MPDVTVDGGVGEPQIAGSAVVLGTPRLGEGSLLAQGAVVPLPRRRRRSRHGLGGPRELGGGRHHGLWRPRSVGAPCSGTAVRVIGVTVGDLCEIGDASKAHARRGGIGDRLLSRRGHARARTGMTLPERRGCGRPARADRAHGVARRHATARGVTRRRSLAAAARTTLTDSTDTWEAQNDGPAPRIPRHTADHLLISAVLFTSAEVTGDVVIGERSIIGAGVKIIGDSHGPVRIGDDVPDPREHRPAPPPRQRPRPRRRRDRRPRRDDPRLSHRRRVRHRAGRDRL